MFLDPRNRHLSVELLPEKEESKPESGVLLPDSYKPVESRYEAVRVIEVAADCSVDCKPGEVVVIEKSMINEMNFNGETFYLVLENYVMGVLEGHKEQKSEGLCGIDTEKYTQ